MNNRILIYAFVEGTTEKIFINKILKPYLCKKNVDIAVTVLSTSKKQKGGDIKFSRAKNEIITHLKQRNRTYVTTMIDYYALKEWPGLEEIKAKKSNMIQSSIANILETSCKNAIGNICNADNRFIPYIAMHEFEALLFSNPEILAKHINIERDLIDRILIKCGEPEAINNSPQTAPSKRLESLYPSFRKTVTGIAIAEEIGIDTMREKCPLFNTWIKNFEKIIDTHHAPF
jgi:hypothetical protein